MTRYELQIFDSRNTCTIDHPELADGNAAHELARKISLTNEWPVVIYTEDRYGFAKYEHGEKTEYSIIKL